MGNSSVHSAAAGGKVAPFFRFPYLQQSPQLSSYLAERNIAIFSTDIDSRDFTMHKPKAGDRFGHEPPLARFPQQYGRSLAGTAPAAKTRQLHGCALGSEGATHHCSQIRRNVRTPGELIIQSSAGACCSTGKCCGSTPQRKHVHVRTGEQHAHAQKRRCKDGRERRLLAALVSRSGTPESGHSRSIARRWLFCFYFIVVPE